MNASADTDDHEQRLTGLLEELGRTLGKRERVLEAMKRVRTQARMHRITVEADQPFEQMEGASLAEELWREIEDQLARERELEGLTSLLYRQRDLEDALFDELDLHLAPEHRDALLEEAREGFVRRDTVLDGLDTATEKEKRRRIPEVIERQRDLEAKLFGLTERHLVRLHRGP